MLAPGAKAVAITSDLPLKYLLRVARIAASSARVDGAAEAVRASAVEATARAARDCRRLMSRLLGGWIFPLRESRGFYVRSESCTAGGSETRKHEKKKTRNA